MNRVNITECELDELLFYAFRYALGRNSYIVSIIAGKLCKYRMSLKPDTKELIRNEIKAALLDNRTGYECDRAQWEIVLREL